MWARRLLVIALTLAPAASCGTSDDAGPAPAPTPEFSTLEQLRDSRACATCHPSHYREWSGSMHAYASEDPLFLAMNRRMQRETNGALGTFCVQCHAPLAVKLGLTKDGLNLDSLPNLKGVTCAFCHRVESVEGVANNALRLSPEPVLGGAIHDPFEGHRTHDAKYVTWLDGTRENSTAACGACHDIITPGGAHIERTFDEWKNSRFGIGEQTKQSCGSCHMPARDGTAADVPGAPVRKVHDHMFVGVDLALTDFPEREAQRAAVQKMLDDAIDAKLCVTKTATGATIAVVLTNQKVGHGWPSGSNQDRRAWLELTAFAGGAPILKTGDVPADARVSAATDPLLFLLRDHLFDKDGAETEMFWEAMRFESKQLPAAVTSNPKSPDFDNSVHKKLDVTAMPDRVTMQINIRPVDYDLIDELVRSGDLDPKTIDPITTFTLAKTKLEWTPQAGSCVE